MAKIIVNENACKGCSLCVGACPKHIVRLQPDKLNVRGYHPAGCVDEAACTGCAFCAVMCPETIIAVER